jgi:hypothetical protein
MIRRIAITAIIAAFVGLLGFLFLPWRPAIALIKHPAQASFTAESIAKGEVLSAGPGILSADLGNTPHNHSECAARLAVSDPKWVQAACTGVLLSAVC